MWHTLAKELDGATTRTTNHLPKLHEDETRSRTTDRRVLHHPYQLLEPNHRNHGRYGFIYLFILISRKHRSSLGVMGPKEEQTKETSSRPSAGGLSQRKSSAPKQCAVVGGERPRGCPDAASQSQVGAAVCKVPRAIWGWENEDGARAARMDEWVAWETLEKGASRG
jgi:hypothetical protein